MQDENAVVVVDDASAGRLEVADDVDVCLWARLCVVPVTPEMDRLEGLGFLSLHNEDLAPVSKNEDKNRIQLISVTLSTFSGKSRPRSSAYWPSRVFMMRYRWMALGFGLGYPIL